MVINYKQKTVIFLSLVLIFELCFIFLPQFPARTIIKLAPSFVLLWFLLELKGVDKFFMLLALFFCMAGDSFLDINRDRLFMGGLISFTLAHVVYLVYFLRNIKKPDNRTTIVVTALFLYGFILAWFLREAPSDLLIPVWVYLGIIIFMAMAAFLTKGVNTFLKIGVLVFVFSDSILALNKFIIPFSFATPLNIFLYFMAQLFIVRGIVSRKSF
ncbi:MAG: lysoplasmalogenase [Spirochaetaceae bacterium]